MISSKETKLCLIGRDAILTQIISRIVNNIECIQTSEYEPIEKRWDLICGLLAFESEVCGFVFG